MTQSAAQGAWRCESAQRGVRVISEWYAVYYRGGRHSYVKIGTYPTLSLGEARKSFRDDYAPAIMIGAEPKLATTRKRYSKNADAVPLEQMFQAYVADLRLGGKRSLVQAERILLSDTCGAARLIGPDRRPAAVSPADIVGFLKPIYDRGADTMADQSRGYLHAAFDYGSTRPMTIGSTTIVCGV